MKKISILASTLLILASSAFAADTTPAKGGKSEAENHPCKAIHQACEAAGFTKGGHAKGGKGLFKDCMQPLMNGTSVAGVSVDSAVIQACKTRKTEHESKGKHLSRDAQE